MEKEKVKGQLGAPEVALICSWFAAPTHLPPPTSPPSSFKDVQANTIQYWNIIESWQRWLKGPAGSPLKHTEHRK